MTTFRWDSRGDGVGLLGGERSELSRQQEIGISQDDVKRCPQLVRHRRDEVRLDPVCLLELFDEAGVVQGAIAPSLSERFGSGTTSSMSMSITLPKPSHSGQAPSGLLKLYSRGSGSG